MKISATKYYSSVSLYQTKCWVLIKKFKWLSFLLLLFYFLLLIILSCFGRWLLLIFWQLSLFFAPFSLSMQSVMRTNSVPRWFRIDLLQPCSLKFLWEGKSYRNPAQRFVLGDIHREMLFKVARWCHYNKHVIKYFIQ